MEPNASTTAASTNLLAKRGSCRLTTLTWSVSTRTEFFFVRYIHSFDFRIQYDPNNKSSAIKDYHDGFFSYVLGAEGEKTTCQAGEVWCVKYMADAWYDTSKITVLFANEEFLHEYPSLRLPSDEGGRTRNEKFLYKNCIPW
ncbi:MAG: hypothetical protein J3R72DRAFT_424452 [Linnemannia gamsii]|nr:MAG: hypothetical protein J3R72DRAFT_424452 [Linnemannia gamsii]